MCTGCHFFLLVCHSRGWWVVMFCLVLFWAKWEREKNSQIYITLAKHATGMSSVDGLDWLKLHLAGYLCPRTAWHHCGMDTTSRWKHLRFCSMLTWYLTQLLQICRLPIHAVTLSFHHIPKVLYWTEIWWWLRSLELTEHIVMLVEAP